ncbi:putative RNA-directed DNA polymerase from transposon X-element [Trichonephila clavipes]|nr:putative RNA-directed DNA polymerase from transposon X-element [Trichonephila clavipes]
MRLIERQLQTTVNRLVQWCDQNGHTISPSKSSCPFLQKSASTPRSFYSYRTYSNTCCQYYQIPYEERIESRYLSIPSTNTFTFGLWLCTFYGSARASVLKRLDTVYHSALRICSGAFKTSPVTSLYVVCHQPPLELRRRQLCANYFIRAMSVPSHPLKPFALAIGLNRLYEARSFNIKPFSERAKAVLNDAT